MTWYSWQKHKTPSSYEPADIYVVGATRENIFETSVTKTTDSNYTFRLEHIICPISLVMWLYETTEC